MAAVWLAWIARFQLNPDGVAYVEVARHWAAGDVSLAVNSWWSPMLSWLLVPFVWAGVPLTLASKLLNAVFGLGFAVAVSMVVKEVTGGAGVRIAFVAGLLVALVMLPFQLTPDVLLACVLTWYFALAMRLFRSVSPGLAAATGLVGGTAYLVKAFALPFVLLHLTMTLLMKLWLTRAGAPGAIARQLAVALAVLGLVAAPWIAAISMRDGTLTFSSAARHWSAWTPFPAPKPRLAYRYLQEPREGRTTTWENPMEVRHPWSVWSSFDGLGGMTSHARTIVQNIRNLPYVLGTVDWLGLLPAGFVVALVLLVPLRDTLKTTQGILLLWTCLSVLLFLGGYMLAIVLSRYTWPIRGLLLALVIAGPAFLGHGGGDRVARWHRVLLFVLLACLALKVEETFYHARIQRSISASWKDAGEAFVPGCRFAGAEYMSGLYVTFWARGVYLGELDGKTAEAVAEELRPFGPATVLVPRDHGLTRALASDATFTPLKLDSPAFQAFGFAGGGCRLRAES